MTITATVQALADFIMTVGTPGTLLYSFGTDDKATQIGRDKYPCAITIPFRNNPGRFEARSMNGGAVHALFTVTQWVIFAPIEQQLHIVLPQIVTFLDNFTTALIATPFYTVISAPSAHNLPNPTAQIQQIPYGGNDFWGIEIIYTVDLNL